jgi:hypothetical protein
MKTIASCVALVALALLVLGACSINVESDEHAARAFCNSGYGLVRPGSKFAVGVPGYCTGSDVCATSEVRYLCCDPSKDPACGISTSAPLSSTVYCGPAGLDRYTGTPPGPVCKPNEICAMHNTADCKATCCDMATDPDCGVPLKKCFQES